jgi:hypothetical protein
LQYYNLVLTTRGAFFLLTKKKEILSFSEKKIGIFAGFSRLNSTNLLIFWKYWKKILYPKLEKKKKKTKTTGQWIRVAIRFLIGQELEILYVRNPSPPKTPVKFCGGVGLASEWTIEINFNIFRFLN